ncbi:endolytic transglycosylase MltG [Ningiella sp. W23]|uniref:endolytic transglycosylase MltG n=1 Tax=Ningiella sp. W23 TaxID=3023715 RepID=UPI0037577437
MLKKLIVSALLFATLMCIAGAVVYYKATQIGELQIDLREATVIQVRKGHTASTVWRELRENKLSAREDFSDILFKIWIRLNPQFNQVKIGYYRFDLAYLTKTQQQEATSISVSDLYQRIADGQQTQFSLMLVEGQTIREWLEALSLISSLQQDIAPIEQVYEQIHAALNIDLSRSFCQNERRSIEGCLLADTYFYEYQDSALSILTRAFKAMDRELDIAWNARYQDIPIATPYEALILASIIEKETGLPVERGVIAGVFSNRLELGMRLQTDPTVIYGIGESFDGDITRAHLREKTAYNTYRIDGLPPTPIAMAGKPSLYAAVQPELTDYLYFVSKGDGSHQFSETLEEHNQAVAEYQLNQ